MTDTDGTLAEVELLIRASTIDGRRKGACLFCQEYFMELYLLAELKTIALKVTTVDMQKPPPDFRSNFEAAHPPILIHDGIIISENDRIERHIMKEIPGGHNLFIQDRETEAKIENLYKKFKMFLLQNTEQTRNGLLNCLRNIDAHLAQKGSRYLTGDSICCFDCELMSRLQNIRVAGKHFYNFEIPVEMHHLWRYMTTMYQLAAFLESCPADQDIIHHYKLQSGMKMSKHEELEEPTITKTVPSDLKTSYENGDHYQNGNGRPSHSGSGRASASSEYL